MGLVKTALMGRKNGIRASIWKLLRGGGAKAAPAATGAAAESPVVVGGVTAGGANKLEPPKDVTPPDGFEVVLHKDALAPGEVTEVIIGGTAIAVANVDGVFHALSNACPHAGGPLGEGQMESSLLRCPYHGWAFDVKDGSCKTNPDVQATIFSVHVEQDAVCVQL
jgi:nitrite reductase (NADH) small subunit/3-phenylpropionate/trans-cinnamate dioxygenase ferredoxin subunit